MSLRERGFKLFGLQIALVTFSTFCFIALLRKPYHVKRRPLLGFLNEKCGNFFTSESLMRVQIPSNPFVESNGSYVIKDTYKDVLLGRRVPSVSHPPCDLKVLSRSEIKSCFLSKMSRNEAFKLQFWGDSRVRNRFNAILWLLQDLNLIISTKDQLVFSVDEYFAETRKIHTDIYVTSDVYPDFRIDFYWLPFLHNQLSSRLLRILESREVLLIVIGCGTWYLQQAHDSLSMTRVLDNYQNSLTNLKSFFLNNLGHFPTKVIWQLQDPLMDENKADTTAITNENVSILNQLTLDALKETGVVLWQSSFNITNEYIQICREMYLTQKNHEMYYSALWNCQDQIHVGLSFLATYAQLVLNPVCNEDAEFCNCNHN